VRAGAQALVAAVASPGASAAEQAEMLDQMEQLLPGLGDFAPYAIDPSNRWVGCTLAQINLRGATGATVLAIRRGAEAVLTPTGRETLEAGDVLVLTGTSEALAAARELLGKR
jgi:CPA2 family monovalent cation:H+ antiporter-2